MEVMLVNDSGTPADGGSVTMDERRLYGLVGAERLFFDPASVYESDIEPWAGETPPTDGRRVEVEEWSVRHPLTHLPEARDIAQWMAENAMDDECDESACDEWGDAWRFPDVTAAAEALREAMAAHVKYRMADKHLRSMWVTWDDQGRPLLDGELLYVNDQEVPRD